MKNFRQLIIGLAIAGFAVYFTFRNVSMKELMESFKTVQYIYLIPAALFSIATYVGRAYRWQILVSPLKQVRVAEMFSPLMVGFMGNILPARAGEVLRAYLLGKKQNISFTGAFATIVVERLFDLLMLLFLFAWVLIFHGKAFDSNAGWGGISLRDMAFKFGILSSGLIAFLVAFIYMVAYHNGTMLRLIRAALKFLPETWSGKIVHLVETFSQGLLVARDFPALAKIMIYSLATWLFIVLSYFPYYWAYDIQNKSAESLVILVVMVCILITVLPTPAFLGSFQAGVLIALHEIMREPEVMAVSFGMVAWAVNFVVLVAMGVYFILHDHLSVKQLVEVEEEGEAALEGKNPGS